MPAVRFFVPRCAVVARWLPAVKRPASAPAVRLLGLLAAALLALACGGEPAAPVPPPRELPALERLNLLVVVVDTLGAEHVSHLAPGLEPPTTPALDRLAAGGVRFDRAYSPAPWTQPAVASLLTGRMPSAHRLVRLFDRLDDGEVTLAERLAERGFATAAVVSHRLVGEGYGFDQGFEHFDSSPAGGHRTVSSAKVTAAALGWLDRWAAGPVAAAAAAAAGAPPANGVGRSPFFLFVHYFDPHYVYRHHPRFDRTAGYAGALTPGMDIWALRDARPRLDAADVGYLRGLYREEVAFTDFHLGRLLAGLARHGVERDTLVVVTADHGEELMRHGWIGHTRTLYDELLRVPLVVSLPGTIAPRRVEEPVSLVDLVPTLLELSARPDRVPSQVPGEGWSRGLSWAATLAGGPPPPADRDLFAEVSFAPGSDEPAKAGEKTAFKTALLAGRWKLIHDLAAGGGEASTWQLFDRAADPEELRDLATASPPGEEAARAFRALRRRLLAWEQEREAAATAGGGPPRVTPDREELERLRALGYLR